MAASTLWAGAVAVLLAWGLLFTGSAAQEAHTQTFRSPGFSLGPGGVIDKYFRVDMPQGHVAIRSFNTHLVDNGGNPIPLSETYLHHWVLLRYYHPKLSSGVREPILAGNAGVCQYGYLEQMFGLGSETRHTDTEIPPPYGIVVGDAEKVPEGYEEVWVLNVHAIDTRGAVDRRGCMECVCDLYNLTEKSSDKQIPEGYEGGLYCCLDEMHCDVLPDYEGDVRNLVMEYYVTWVEMSDDVVPVNVYILDVTDGTIAVNSEHSCKVEYTVDKCAEGESSCINTAENLNFLSNGGDLIYAVAHQHAGGIGSTLYSADGEELCSSMPTYGNGSEPGNEAGYIVGMSTCYPQPGTKKIRAGEALRLTSSYNNEDRHTGVMGLFYLLVDESQAAPPERNSRKSVMLLMTTMTVIAAMVLIGAIVSTHLKTKTIEPQYERINA